MILRFDSTAQRDAFVERLGRERDVSATLHAAKNLPDVVVDPADPEEQGRIVALASEFSGRPYANVAFAPFGETQRH